MTDWTPGKVALGCAVDSYCDVMSAVELLTDAPDGIDDVAVSCAVDVEVDVLGDGMHELVNAAAVEDVDVLKEVLSDVGVVELVVPDVTMKYDVLIFGDVLVDVDAIKPN
eukprot:3812286-Amphidinium_carterae.1